jgi:AraC-like DNA-binding protein
MPSVSSTRAPLRFSTTGLPERARDRGIRELRERGLLPIEPLRGSAVQVRLTKWFLPDASVLSGTLGGVRQVGGPRARDASDDLFLGVNLAGGSVATQGRRETTLRDGDAIVVSDAGGPFTLTRPARVRFLGVRVPRRAVAPLMLGVDSGAMRLIPRGIDAVALMTRYVDAVLDTRVLTSAEVSRAVATHLHDLVALSAGATRDGAAIAQARGVRAARLEAIKADIRSNLVDETLAVTTVAARHGVTPRYVHKLFEDEGVTYTQFVVQHRLDRALRMLRDPRLAARRISEIAYDVGFGDLSYFNRVFRRRYDATPSDIRNNRPGDLAGR